MVNLENYRFRVLFRAGLVNNLAYIQNLIKALSVRINKKNQAKGRENNLTSDPGEIL